MGKRMSQTYIIGGFKGTLEEIANKYKINPRTLQTRLRSGWTIERACLTPVDKSRSNKLPTILTIGNFRGNADKVYNWFGVRLTAHKSRVDSDEAAKKIQAYSKPVFYKVSDNYTGSLIAISKDFKCPLSELKKGLKNGKTVPEILEAGGYLDDPSEISEMGVFVC